MKIQLLLGLLAFSLTAPVQAAPPRGDEPIPIPTTVRQGIDFIYVDPGLSTVARKNQRPTNWLARAFGARREHKPNQLFSALSENLEKYAKWRWNPSTSFSEAGNRWALAAQESFTLGTDPAETLKAAAADINAVTAACEQFPTAPLVAVFDFGWAEVDRQVRKKGKVINWTAIERSLQIGTSEEVSRLEVSMSWLATIAAITPFSSKKPSSVHAQP